MKLLKLIGANVRQFRKIRGLTQAQLAETVNLSVEMIGKIERGVAAPSLESIEKVVEALDVPPEALFGAKLDKIPEGQRSELINAIYVKLSKMNETNLKRINKIIDAMIV